ncbi:MAG: diaminopimelate decarboxylase [Halanaerobium sp.]|nr:diaminopimelate decarboxylase [Halanaerobium sp.]
MSEFATGKNDNFVFAGCDTVKLAEKYGSPLLVYDEMMIRNNSRRLKNTLKKYYGNQSRVVYAGKAFMSLEMCRLAREEELYLDVVSGGELYTALKAGFPPERILFHGNNKSKDELAMAIRAGVGRIIIDNFLEIEMLQRLCEEEDTSVDAMLRITPGVDAHTHEYVNTGHIDTKFGFTLENGTADRAVEEVLLSPQITLKGFHCHIGSQVFIDEPYLRAAEVMLQFSKRMEDRFGYRVQELNLGGGFGIQYTEDDTPEEPSVILKSIAAKVHELVAELGLEKPAIYIEPGRSIVGEAGITIYQIGAVKDIPGIRKYVSVDGGMADNIRPALYGSRYSAIIASKPTREPEELVSIAGKCCESGDMLIKDIKLPRAEPGDYLVVFSTGAYHYSMASNYNRLPRPAVVFASEGQARLVVKRETYSDLIKNDLIYSQKESGKLDEKQVS